MAKEFKLEDPGEGIHEAEIVQIHASPGDHVSEGDVLFTVETDKAETEVPSPFTGTIREIRVEAGDVAQVGDVLVTYSEGAEAGDAAAGQEEEPEEEGEADKKAQQKKQQKKEKEAEGAEKESRKKAEEEAAAEAEEEEKREDEEKEEQEETPRRRSSGHEGRLETGAGAPVPASPATRRLARELGVELESVEGSGPEGRVTSDDVRTAAGEEKGKEEQAAEGEEREEKEEGEAPPARRPEPGERKAFELPRIDRPRLPDFTKWGEVERVPLRSVRRATARRMALAWSQVAHVTHQDVADITELERFRKKHVQEVAKEGAKLTLTVLVMKAVVGALKEYPRFNSSLDVEAGEIVLRRYYNLGIAVETERGLLVPVVRDVDRKSITELAVDLGDLADRARSGDVSREDLTGGTFTITNPGPIGGTAFTPIINWPQVAILGIARSRLEPVVEGTVEDHRIVARLRLPLSLAFDHRVVDGADAAHFVCRIMDLLADPEELMLAV